MKAGEISGLCGALISDEFRRMTADGSLLAESFSRNDYCVIPNFFRPWAISLLRAEVQRLLPFAKRRQLKMKESSGTIRSMNTLGSIDLASYSCILPAIYQDNCLMDLLSIIAGEAVFAVKDRNEQYVLNCLTSSGDVHGAHVDTYSFAFNILIETPPQGAGGVVEVLPGSTDVKRLAEDGGRKIALQSGDCYFMRAGKVAHGVSPIQSGRRLALNLAYCSAAERPIPTSYSSNSLYA